MDGSDGDKEGGNGCSGSTRGGRDGCCIIEVVAAEGVAGRGFWMKRKGMVVVVGREMV